ncbi:MAG: hypothetical protein Q7T20_09555, partial [Saprospiraceae bacterium]|nr:hypothetical protein [Saprospiraceae bacterium]
LGQMSRESRSVPTQFNKMPRCLRTAGHSCLAVYPIHGSFPGRVEQLLKNLSRLTASGLVGKLAIAPNNKVLWDGFYPNYSLYPKENYHAKL